jgi:hypothetical protein
MKNICSDCSPHTFPPCFVGAADVVALRFHLARESLTGEELRGGVGAGAPRRRGEVALRGRCRGAPQPRPHRGGSAAAMRRGSAAEQVWGFAATMRRGSPAALRRGSWRRGARVPSAPFTREKLPVPAVCFSFFYMSRPVLVGCRVKTIRKLNPAVGLSLDGGYQHARLILTCQMQVTESASSPFLPHRWQRIELLLQFH